MEFFGNIARKTGNPNILRLETEKMRRAADIGSSSGLFRVPAIRHFDASAGVLDSERIEGLIAIGAIIASRYEMTAELVDRAGRALASIHSDLSLTEDLANPLPEPWAASTEETVFIHGDFTVTNVCVDIDTGSLVIVDWSATPLIEQVATSGARTFDVQWFCLSLHMAAPWKQTFSWPADELCDRFLQAYVGEYGAKLDGRSWKQFRTETNRIARQIASIHVGARGRPAKFFKAILQRHLYRQWLSYRAPTDLLTAPRQ